MGVGDRYKENLNRGSYGQRTRSLGRALTARKRRASRSSAVYDRRMGRGLGIPGVGRSAWPGEKKGMDTGLAQASGIIATTNTNANAVVLNLIRSGAGSWERVGRKVNMLSLRLKGVARCQVTPNAVTGAIALNYLRMVVVHDALSTGAAIPAYDQIFAQQDQAGTESGLVLSLPKYDNAERFKVLRDMMLTPNTAAIASLGTTQVSQFDVCFDEYLKLKGIPATYATNSAPMTIADISSGAIYIYFRATTASDVAWEVVSGSSARLRYGDL